MIIQLLFIYFIWIFSIYAAANACKSWMLRDYLELLSKASLFSRTWPCRLWVLLIFHLSFIIWKLILKCFLLNRAISLHLPCNIWFQNSSGAENTAQTIVVLCFTRLGSFSFGLSGFWVGDGVGWKVQTRLEAIFRLLANFTCFINSILKSSLIF